MTNTAKNIIDTARKLPATDREAILEAMLISLHEQPLPEVQQAWRNLVDERISALEGDESDVFDFEDAVAELKRK